MRYGNKNCYDDYWCDAKFMSFEKGEGRFFPETDKEKKLHIANQIANVTIQFLYAAYYPQSFNLTL